MTNLIPFVLENEKNQRKLELGTKDVSIIFDGTTCLGEVLVVVVRIQESLAIDILTLDASPSALTYRSISLQLQEIDQVF